VYVRDVLMIERGEGRDDHSPPPQDVSIAPR
jgi:hypothetical protein